MDRFDRKLKAMARRESSALPSQIEEVISRTLTELPDKPLSQSSCKPTAASCCPASAVTFESSQFSPIYSAKKPIIRQP